MRIRSLVLGSMAPLMVALAAAPAAGQQDPAAMLASAQRAMVSRADLRASLDNIKALTSSPGYSETMKSAKLAEADLIRDRLTNGDFHTGDVISLTVVGEQSLTGTYTVTATRSIILPGGSEVSLKGWLRSELQDSLTKELAKFVRDPIVRATPAIQIEFKGAVGKVGFFNTSANISLPDVIMTVAGGPGNNAVWDKSEIKRADHVIVEGPEFGKAIQERKTLDQLNVEAGDQIFIAQKSSGGGFWRWIGAAGSLLTIVVLGRQLF